MRFLVLASLGVVAAVPAFAQHLEGSPADGRIVVNAYRAGLLSGFAHDHHFDVRDWRATVDIPGGDVGAASVHVVLVTDSLHDTQPRLSEKDRRKVDAQAVSSDYLDAAKHPQIEFRSDRIELEPAAAGAGSKVRGKIHGTLTVRGRPVPTEVPFEAERASGVWHVHATARVKQSAFGMRPFKGFAGTIRVKDETTVEIAMTLRPTSRSP